MKNRCSPCLLALTAPAPRSAAVCVNKGAGSQLNGVGKWKGAGYVSGALTLIGISEGHAQLLVLHEPPAARTSLHVPVFSTHWPWGVSCMTARNSS